MQLSRPSVAVAQAVHAQVDEVLDLIISLESQDSTDFRWTERIRSVRFQQHNDEWCERLALGDHQLDVKGPNGATSGLDSRSSMKWADAGGLADRCWGSPCTEKGRWRLKAQSSASLYLG